MGTRSGGIDANAVLRLVEDNGLDRTKGNFEPRKRVAWPFRGQI
jgi:hypothetical protein